MPELTKEIHSGRLSRSGAEGDLVAGRRRDRPWFFREQQRRPVKRDRTLERAGPSQLPKCSPSECWLGTRRSGVQNFSRRKPVIATQHTRFSLGLVLSHLVAQTRGSSLYLSPFTTVCILLFLLFPNLVSVVGKQRRGEDTPYVELPAGLGNAHAVFLPTKHPSNQTYHSDLKVCPKKKPPLLR